ncbi:MAG: hypothetical protein Dasosvirus3_29 [Dasosvirus sp.]|uniref:MORN repeat-containing protein n=1 Tax=Dasosvirus sp. TaxID=2487764 RepID=A0A3G4ZRD7_9VIRU|nr:MAG: hypothetical protein Dasosvirus3_29 [Dasosvirus sp.]
MLCFSQVDGYILDLKLLENSTTTIPKKVSEKTQFGSYLCDKAIVIDIRDRQNVRYDKINTKNKKIMINQEISCKLNPDYGIGITIYLERQVAFYKDLNTTNYTGDYFEWDEYGQIQRQCTYKEGKLNGESRKWHGNGQLHLTVYYTNDKMNGWYKMWNSDGYLMYDENYENDVQHGENKLWNNGYLCF